MAGFALDDLLAFYLAWSVVAEARTSVLTFASKQKPLILSETFIQNKRHTQPQRGFMGRHLLNEHQRSLPKIWVQHLLYKLGAELWQLNAQLTLPPDEGKPFRFWSSPHPLSRPWAPRTFERAWKHGKNPDVRAYADLLCETGHYNLFLRVAQHVEFSEDWLFRPLRPYFETALPPVTTSSALVQALLQRLGLRRLSDSATKFAIRVRPATVGELDTKWMHLMAERPDPIHLMLLIAMFHERKWHYPDAPETRELSDACFLACHNFFSREEFCPPALDENRRCDFWNAVRSVWVNIVQTGHRSAPPQLPRNASLFDRRPSGPDAVGLLTMSRCVIYEPFESCDDAMLTAGYGCLMPAFLFADRTPTPYRPLGGVPSPAETCRALADLLAAADISPERVCRYGRDESVKQELERLRFGGVIDHTSQCGSANGAAA